MKRLKLYNKEKVAPLIKYLNNFEKNLVRKENKYPNIANEETITLSWFAFKAFNELFNKISDFTTTNLYSRAIFSQMKKDNVTCK
jgi:hypothetical protein